MNQKSVIPLLISILIFLIALASYAMKNDKTDYEVLQINHYDIEIDVQKTNVEKLNEEIQKYEKEQINRFFHTIDITPYNYALLNIDSKITSSNGITHVILSSTIESDEFKKKHKTTFYYNQETNEMINLSSYLISEQYLQNISNLSYHAVIADLTKNNITIEETIIRESTNHLENYKFTDNGLEMLFILENDVDIEISITIPYAEINYLLKEQYRKELQGKYQRDLEQFKNKKLIAFTFDDGPNEYITNLLLDGLSKYNAKVTFFVLGNKVNENANVLKRAYEEGNQIGSHTYNHKNLIRLNQTQFQLEIDHTKTVVREIIGEEPSIIRPPYGNINKSIRNYIDVPIIMWNIDPLDWQYKDKETVKNNIVSEAEDGDIVLLHDIYPTSVEGALLAMEELYNQGFAFVTIEEMAKLKGIEWEQGKYYYKFE